MIIPHNKVPEIKGHHAKSMAIMLGIALIAVSFIVIPRFVFGMGVGRWMGIPIFCAPVAFFIFIFIRSRYASCPDCLRRMEKSRNVLVIEPRKVLGKYQCSPWNIFHCRFCDKDWRIPAIKVGVKGAIHRISEEEKDRIEQAGVGDAEEDA